MWDISKKYTLKEEIINVLTHELGALLALYGMVLLINLAQDVLQTTAAAIFGATMFFLFQASACYHTVTDEKIKLFLRKIDHGAIFLLIAGTYTPFLLMAVPHPHSLALILITWYLALMGVIFSFITLKFKYFSTGLYLIMGWLSVFLVAELWHRFGSEVVWYLLGGGVVYSIGSIFYLLKYRYMHGIWHLFVLGGAWLHYLAIIKLLQVTV